jgi:hypothetical protein
VRLLSNEGGNVQWTNFDTSDTGGDVLCAIRLAPSLSASPSISARITPSTSASPVPIEAVYRGVLLKKVALNDLARTGDNAVAVCGAIGFSPLCNMGNSKYFHDECIQVDPSGGNNDLAWVDVSRTKAMRMNRISQMRK